MNVIDIFNLGNKYQAEGNIDMALQLWAECGKMSPVFSVNFINMYNVYRQRNDLPKAKECIHEFLRRPITGETLDMIPKIKSELEEINKQLNPQPAK